MKKFKQIALLTVLSNLFIQPVWADEAAMQSLKGRLAELTSFQGKFEQIVKDQEGNELQTGEGAITLAQPLKIRWQQEMPDDTLFVSSGATTYYYDTFAEQVTILDTTKLIDTTPFVLLTTQEDSQWLKYNVALNGQEYLITPKNKVDSQVEQLTLRFDDKNDGLALLKVNDISGQVSTFSFKESKVNVPVKESLFEFTIPQGVVVDDQRGSD
ncbi:outer membrane lipoprotein chaperone LolA [Pseudoalteromonas sp. CO348]|uniref:Outer-membrane lipoprotein carrier protein n=1 Tax=Pseudoalteromonas maricaloris TaxID=184924 RepID=A0A8I2KPA3_9GAMM|nr:MULTISPECIES: outer membrane lipoprotein chaperone LolA [Pseudoalteromonas]MCG7539818.1 outer membrane lipoprotein chaperone LolA [Pseudoalteromonas sp. OF7H-1]MCG9771174.1 outer membrane lipoprotein chaperone LolA [Pseudoalteromonas piscicida]NLR23601.1 outer membrane lipoprotein chaperone LolA [Pseudoalteromonas maricaloris]ODB37142.1 outer membrane lipoprotein carrier protein LolA [Pseudoalteromonas sp. BMB]QZO11316.1 outer membrane lipoprotein chaperone LolA [Pseudoalteromonas piscicida